mmetsp:Transcript_24372/g.21543  ORF Transcript_24372/g.21543 Transcript_24372/m.21543 type:complete len:105 (+) Transcript_24372:50-364(+)
MANSHLKALLHKNWILWKRNMCCSILEILIPVFFMFIFAVFRNLEEAKTIETRSYLENEQYSLKFAADNARVFEEIRIKCEKDRRGGKIGLVPPNNDYVDAIIQ